MAFAAVPGRVALCDRCGREGIAPKPRPKGLAMRTVSKSRAERRVPSLVTLAIRVMILLLPAVLLLFSVQGAEGNTKSMLALGSVFQILVCCLSFFSQRGWREPIGPSAVTLYLIALGWLWLVQPQ